MRTFVSDHWTLEYDLAAASWTRAQEEVKKWRIFADALDAAQPASFPLPHAAQLPVDRRFGSKVAALASDLTVHRRQRIDGAGHDGTVALLLFGDDTVTEVVPVFERMAAATSPASCCWATRPAYWAPPRAQRRQGLSAVRLLLRSRLHHRACRGNRQSHHYDSHRPGASGIRRRPRSRHTPVERNP
ncbi:hypothetical protein [Streptomyces sp. 4N124]|uniref:hypothetical protein n=1 Tax=Streptomyces sp. 4N124 TaxID=3457420 RepID=UPI003FD432BF